MNRLKRMLRCLPLLLLFLCSAAFASVEAQPGTDAAVERGDTISYTITAEEDLAGAAVRVALSPGLELDQNSVSAPEGTLYFGSDGLVLMADLAKGDAIRFAATVSDSAETAVCTISGSIEETVSHTLAARAEPAEQPQADAPQPAQAAQQPGQDPLGFFALIGAAAAGGGIWLLARRRAKRAAQDSPAVSPVPAQDTPENAKEAAPQNEAQ